MLTRSLQINDQNELQRHVSNLLILLKLIFPKILSEVIVSQPWLNEKVQVHNNHSDIRIKIENPAFPSEYLIEEFIELISVVY